MEHPPKERYSQDTMQAQEEPSDKSSLKRKQRVINQTQYRYVCSPHCLDVLFGVYKVVIKK